MIGHAPRKFPASRAATFRFYAYLYTILLAYSGIVPYTAAKCKHFCNIFQIFLYSLYYIEEQNFLSYFCRSCTKPIYNTKSCGEKRLRRSPRMFYPAIIFRSPLSGFRSSSSGRLCLRRDIPPARCRCRTHTYCSAKKLRADFCALVCQR